MPGQSAMPDAADATAVDVLSARLGDAASPVLPGILEFLARVPDHRCPQGRRHGLACILGLACAATAAGAKSLVAMGEWAEQAPPEVLESFGVRRDRCGGALVPPGESPIRRALSGTDPAALDAQLDGWLEACTVPEADDVDADRVMVDGKRLRGAVREDGRHPAAAVAQTPVIWRTDAPAPGTGAPGQRPR